MPPFDTPTSEDRRRRAGHATRSRIGEGLPSLRPSAASWVDEEDPTEARFTNGGALGSVRSSRRHAPARPSARVTLPEPAMERAKARKRRKRARRRSNESLGSTSVPAIALPNIEHEAPPRRDLAELLRMLRTLATSEDEVVRSARWCIAAVFCGICVALFGVAMTSPHEPARRVASFEYAAHAANAAEPATDQAPFAFPATGLPPGALAASANVRAVAPPPAVAALPPKAIAPPKRVVARPVAKPVRPTSRPR